MVKLTRTLSIIPTVLIFCRHQRACEKCRMNVAVEGAAGQRASRSSRGFILGFLGSVRLFNSVGLHSRPRLAAFLKDLSKFLMVAALAAIGLNTEFLVKCKKRACRPMLHGFIISALVVVVALLVEMAMGLV